MTSTGDSPQDYYVYVCVTCDEDPTKADTVQAETGKSMLKALKLFFSRSSDFSNVKIKSVKCMGGCERPCSVGLNAVGKQACLFVDMSPEHPEEVADILYLYRKSPIGRIKMKDLPEALKKKYLCRIPQAKG